MVTDVSLAFVVLGSSTVVLVSVVSNKVWIVAAVPTEDVIKVSGFVY